VIVDQLSFIEPDWIASLNGSYMQMVSPSPQVHYVALSPMSSTSDDLDPEVDMVISSIGLLEPDLFTSVTTLDMVSFQSVFLPSSEDLLEAMCYNPNFHHTCLPGIRPSQIPSFAKKLLKNSL
jgi:hypothetical protein